MIILDVWKYEVFLLEPNWHLIDSTSSWIVQSLPPNLWVVLTPLPLALILTLTLNLHQDEYKCVILPNAKIMTFDSFSLPFYNCLGFF